MAKAEEGHIVSGNCSVYSDLQSQFGDLGEDQNLMQFFWAVLDRRDRLEEEDRTWQPPTATVVASPVPGDRQRQFKQRKVKSRKTRHIKQRQVK